MSYQVGDTVVHWAHGVGSIIAIDEIQMTGSTKEYYVVDVQTMKLWVPVDAARNGAIRYPLERAQFTGLFDILRTPGEPLPDRYLQRKGILHSRVQERTLEGLCHVIRDLTDRARHHILNDYDALVLSSAEKCLLDEWVVSLGANRSDAVHELENLLL